MLDFSNNFKWRSTFVLFFLTSFLSFNSIFAQVTGYTRVGSAIEKFSGNDGVGNTISQTQSGAPGGTFNGIINNSSTDDFEFECGSMTTNSEDQTKGAIIFRYTNSSNFYAIAYDWDQWGSGQYDVRLKKANFQGHNTTNQLASHRGSVVTSLKLRVVGDSIKVWINGTLRFNLTDASYTTGDYGFACGDRANSDNVSWASPVWTDATVVLPIELLDFHAKKGENHVTLHWTSLVEINADYYRIMKSEDGKSWESIGKVTAAGNSSYELNYELIDFNPNEKNYYRLDQFDYDGTHNIYKTIFVEFKNSSNEFSLYPNPLGEDQLKLKSQTEGEFNLKVIDELGRLVYDEYISLKIGENLLPKKLSELIVGAYFIIINNEQQQSCHKLIKL